MLSHKFPQCPNIIALVFEEIEAEHAPKAQLKKIVIQGLLRDTHKTSRIFERIPDRLTIPQVDPIVQFPPKRNSLDNISNLPFFGSLLVTIRNEGVCLPLGAIILTFVWCVECRLSVRHFLVILNYLRTHKQSTLCFLHCIQVVRSSLRTQSYLFK